MEPKLKMLIDIHTHLVNKNFIKSQKINLAAKLMLKNCGYTNFDDYIKNFLKQLSKSKLDKTVLIGINNSPICADNAQVYDVCKTHSQFLFGVNLNPYDADIENKIQNTVKNNAVLVKVLPSYQNINLAHEKCILFFELLKQYNLPLLVHTGIEHTLPSKNQDLNNPLRLEKAAKIGVKVICAHCGGRMFLHEKNYFKEWKELALKYENVYGDLSAMINPVQWFNLKTILKNSVLKNKVLFGTDYPAFPVIPFQKSSNNIFVDCCNYFEKIGFDSTIYTNAEKVLNL